jgi:TolB-like protein
MARYPISIYSHILAFVTLYFVSSSAQIINKYTVAVLPFQASGISNGEAELLMSRLNSELVKTNKFVVVERSRVDELLAEIGFQQTSVVTTIEYAAKVGRLLGAQYIITGNIGRIGETNVLETRMIEVSSGRIIRTTSNNFRGKIDGMLDILKEVALKLTDLYQKPFRNRATFNLGSNSDGGLALAAQYFYPIKGVVKGSLSARHFKVRKFTNSFYSELIDKNAISFMTNLLIQITERQIYPYFGGGIGVILEADKNSAFQVYGGAQYFLTKQIGINGEIVFIKTALNQGRDGYSVSHYSGGIVFWF